MEMVVVFKARLTGSMETERVFESGEGRTEDECVADAHTKMLGCDYGHTWFVEAFRLKEVD